MPSIAATIIEKQLSDASDIMLAARDGDIDPADRDELLKEMNDILTACRTTIRILNNTMVDRPMAEVLNEIQSELFVYINGRRFTQKSSATFETSGRFTTMSLTVIFSA